jgi:hypothetical protein
VTGSISRNWFRRVLLLYPESFRQEFGDEMLSMFEECSEAQGCWRVLADVLLSAAKQQVHYLSIPAPKSAPLYLEIAWSPSLARILAVAMFGVVLIASVLEAGGKSVARESRAMPCTRSRTIAIQTTMQLIHLNSGAWPDHE